MGGGGWVVSYMAMQIVLGQMGRRIVGIMKEIEDMEMAHFIFLMAASLQGNGWMESGTVWVFSFLFVGSHIGGDG